MPVSLLFVILTTGTDGDQIPPPRCIEPLHPRIDALIPARRPNYAKESAPLSDDAEFVRRIYLDLTGTLPTPAEARAFLDDKTPGKRVKLIDTLLASPGYVRRMVWFWDVTLMERRADSKVPRPAG